MRKILVFRVAQISCPHILEAPLVEECFSWFELSSFVPTKGNVNVKESIYILDSSLLPTLWQQFEERPLVTLKWQCPHAQSQGQEMVRREELDRLTQSLDLNRPSNADVEPGINVEANISVGPH